MTSVLQQITQMVLPPSEPIGLDRDWGSVEREIGLELPPDYKEFVDLYGSGVLCGEMYVWNFRSAQFTQAPIKEKLCGERSVIHGYERVRMQGGYEWPFEMYPKEDGLLPFATLYDVDNLNWLTKGDSGQWDIVYWFSDGNEFVFLQGDSFAKFLLKILCNEYDADEMPRFDEPYEFTQL